MEQYKELKYTLRCINESMRLYPHPPVLLRRALKEDTLPNGMTVPKDQDVMLAIYNIHRCDARRVICFSFACSFELCSCDGSEAKFPHATSLLSPGDSGRSLIYDCCIRCRFEIVLTHSIVEEV